MWYFFLIPQRKFVRDSESVPQTNFYSSFREWLTTNFPVLNEAIWDEILEEDRNVDYSTIGSGTVELVEEEVIGENVIESNVQYSNWSYLLTIYYHALRLVKHYLLLSFNRLENLCPTHEVVLWIVVACVLQFVECAPHHLHNEGRYETTA